MLYRPLSLSIRKNKVKVKVKVKGYISTSLVIKSQCLLYSLRALIKIPLRWWLFEIPSVYTIMIVPYTYPLNQITIRKCAIDVLRFTKPTASDLRTKPSPPHIFQSHISQIHYMYISTDSLEHLSVIKHLDVISPSGFLDSLDWIPV